MIFPIAETLNRENLEGRIEERKTQNIQKNNIKIITDRILLKNYANQRSMK